MNEIKLDMSKVVQDAKDAAYKAAEANIKQITKNLIDGHFRAPGEWNKTSGIAYDMIKQAADNYILSDAFAAKISKAIENAADESANHAAQFVMNKLARKLAFTALDGIEKDA